MGGGSAWQIVHIYSSLVLALCFRSVPYWNGNLNTLKCCGDGFLSSAWGRERKNIPMAACDEHQAWMQICSRKWAWPGICAYNSEFMTKRSNVICFIKRKNIFCCCHLGSNDGRSPLTAGLEFSKALFGHAFCLVNVMACQPVTLISDKVTFK